MSSPFLNFEIPELILAKLGPPSFMASPYITSTQAIPIPLHWGSRRIAGNVIWVNPVLSTEPVFVPTYFGGTTGQKLSVPVQLDGPDAGGVGWSGNNPSGTHVAFALPQGGFIGAISFDSGVLSLPGSWSVANSVPGALGNIDPSNQSAIWWVPTIVGLCEGPVFTVFRQWSGGTGAAFEPSIIGNAITPTLLNSYNPAIGVISAFDTLLTGSSTQTAWGYFAAQNAAFPGTLTGQNLAYRYTACIASSVMNWGNDLRPPNRSFEVVHIPVGMHLQNDSYPIAQDVCPADVIVDFLTSAQYGPGGFTTSDFDSASLTTYLQYCIALGLYFSPLLDSQTAITEIIDRWAAVTNTWIYWDGTVIRFVPLGDETLTGGGQTYTPDPSAAYNLGPGDFLPPGITVQRADPIDCYNRVRLEICDRLADYAKNPLEWKDSTLIALYGLLDANSVDGQDICDIVVGAKVIDLIGKRMAYLRNTYTFQLSDARYLRLLPGTIVTITDPNLGLSAFSPVRITKVEGDADGVLSITAEEFPGTLGIARPQTFQSWSNSGAAGGSAGGGSSGGSGTGPSTGGGGVLSGPGTVAPAPILGNFGVVYYTGHVGGGGWTLDLSGMQPGQIVFLVNVPPSHGGSTIMGPSNNPNANAVTLSVAALSGAQIESPQDRTLALATTQLLNVDGQSYAIWRDPNSNIWTTVVT